MDAKVTWKSGMSFDGSANSGFTLPLGTDPSVGGANDGFRPIELLAVGLAGCTSMDVVSILAKKRQDVAAFEVQVHTEQQSEHPHVFTQAVLTYYVTGHAVDEAAVVRAIELSATKYCPAISMLSKAFPMTLNYEIYERNSGEDQLIKKGSWVPVAL